MSKQDHHISDQIQMSVDCSIFQGKKNAAITVKTAGSEVGINGGEVPVQFIELAHIIVRVIEAYQKGVDLERWFTPDRNVEQDLEIVKCQWAPDGTLRVIEPSAEKRFMHAEDVEEAMSRARNFTCTRYVYRLCPKRRLRGQQTNE